MCVLLCVALTTPSLMDTNSAVWGLLALILSAASLASLLALVSPLALVVCLLPPAAVTLLSEQLEEQLVPSRRAWWFLPAIRAAW